MIMAKRRAIRVLVFASLLAICWGYEMKRVEAQRSLRSNIMVVLWDETSDTDPAAAGTAFGSLFGGPQLGYNYLPAISLCRSSPTSTISTHISPQHGEYIGELELRYSLFSQPGKLRLMGWANIANAGSYSGALAVPVTTPNYPDITLTRQVRSNYGFRRQCARTRSPGKDGEQSVSEAGIPASVLAAISRRPLRTGIGRRTVIIGEGFGLGPRPVIVLVADVVGEPMKAGMVMGPRLYQARRYGQGGQDYGGGDLQLGHLDSPATPEGKTS
jgi:hypothetical protein